MTQPTPMLTGSDDGAFNPTQIPGCVLWLAADKMGLADGAAVAQWSDLSGRGNHAVQATVAKRPVFNLAQLNGLPGLTFSNANLTNLVSTFAATVAQPSTYFLVARHDGPVNTMFFDGNASGHNTFYIDPSNALALYAGLSPAGGAITSPTGYHVWEVIFNGAASASYRDGIVVQSNINPGAQGVTGLNIGTYGGLQAMTGVINEMTVHQGLKSPSERAAIRAYLGSKYAIGVS